MTTSAGSSTPTSVPSAHPGFRRSITVPALLANPPRPPTADSSGGAESVEVLFVHPFAKVVSFTTSSSTSRPSSSSSRGTDGPDRELYGTLSWTSPTERTMAAGSPLRIYRVPNSVSFLHSGTLLHAILPKSQCWCVDQEGRFVLRIRLSSYYRIELPWDNDENKQKVEEFKSILISVLQYEKTPCPFKGGPHVEMPERPETPRRRSLQPVEKAKRWKLNRVWTPEDAGLRAFDGTDTSTTSASEDDDSNTVSASSATEHSPGALEVSESVENSPESLQIPRRPRALRDTRSVTAPAQMIVRKTEGPQLPSAQQDSSDPPSDSVSLASSVDSFCSFPELPPVPLSSSHLAPASVYGDAVEEQYSDIEVRKPRARHRRDISDITITPNAANRSAGPTPLHSPLSEDSRLRSAPSTPTLMSDSEDALSSPSSSLKTPPDTIRLRPMTGASQRRSYSPMPHAVNLFTPPRRQLGTVLVQKTAEILLSPPSHLIALMLRIAANFTRGAFTSPSSNSRGGRIPCSWESSGDEEDDWGEDDYGIPLTTISSAESKRNRSGTRLETG
ncbi:hypothetical protein W97_04712 [Coniosporium apollinis CBS 100218]|uniref:Inheritance of peroxisomes protein 1 n=1 Tax=Coniosporium apollinis (strain CBS 100218) TaxID=1168221 RepID=R7YUI9_CONA1|nr:uncharacterized protein W97_04712 [Coniosporium apollinis CBS 100218]EON65474.1 hypothetical protein W97_04712 [Coniosporium apollinis CBS 100218]